MMSLKTIGNAASNTSKGNSFFRQDATCLLSGNDEGFVEWVGFISNAAFSRPFFPIRFSPCTRFRLPLFRFMIFLVHLRTNFWKFLFTFSGILSQLFAMPVIPFLIPAAFAAKFMATCGVLSLVFYFAENACKFHTISIIEVKAKSKLLFQKLTRVLATRFTMHIEYGTIAADPNFKG